MRITESRLRRVIRQVMSESAITPETMINRYKSRPSDWTSDVEEQFIDMFKGGNGDIFGYGTDIKSEFYSDWENKDFIRVVMAVNVDPLIDEIMELSEEERDYLFSKIKNH